MKPFVLCIFPPVYDFALYDLYLKPYSLLKLGNWFRQCGYDVSILNCLDYTEIESSSRLGAPRRKHNGTGKFFRQPAPKPRALEGIPRYYFRYGILPEVIRKKIAARRPDLILVASGMTYWYPGVKEVCLLAKEIWPAVPLLTGGTYTTLCPEHCREELPVDYIVAGDAFPQLLQILQQLALPHNFQPTEAPLLLPEIYKDAAVIRINNGCPFRCQYCASYALAGAFRQGDPDQAFRLVQQIHNVLGTKVFAFYDDALLVKKEAVFIPFLEKILAAGLKLHFYLPNALHLDLMDAQVATLMYQTGFQELRIGFESSSEDFHTSLDQKMNITAFGNKIALLRAAGFQSTQISLYILAGLPGQYKEEVEQSIHYAATFGVNVYLAEYSPVPQSLLWEKSISLSSFPLATEPLTHNNSILPLQWEHFSLDDLQALKALALKLCRG